MVRLRDRAQRSRVALRIAHDIGAHEGLSHFQELSVNGLVHVYTFDGAAALTGVVDRAIDDVFDSLDEVAVGSDVCRVVAAELKAGMQEALDRGEDHAVATENRPGKNDMVYARIAH